MYTENCSCVFSIPAIPGGHLYFFVGHFNEDTSFRPPQSGFGGVLSFAHPKESTQRKRCPKHSPVFDRLPPFLKKSGAAQLALCSALIALKQCSLRSRFFCGTRRVLMGIKNPACADSRSKNNDWQGWGNFSLWSNRAAQEKSD